MGNSESATSDEEDMANDLAMEESNEVIKVFQPRKLRDELENGKNFVIGKETDGLATWSHKFCVMFVPVKVTAYGYILQIYSNAYLFLIWRSGFDFTCKHHILILILRLEGYQISHKSLQCKS